MDKPHRGVFVSALQPHRNIVTTPPPILVPLAFIPVPVRLLKYQALGNDYLVLDLPGPLEELVALLPVLCDRNFGLGSDGLLAFDPAAMSVRIFNPDRSEAQKSGNGLRITAAHAVLEHGAGDRFSLRTVDRSNAVLVLSRRGV